MSSRPAPRLSVGGLPEPPATALAVFGERLPQAWTYATRLAEDGSERGLIGPREVGRLWERHLLNCAALCELVPVGARVVDVGAGAGLPGIPMAIRRPDLGVDLVEPMQRRVDFLREVVPELGLADRVRVVRGRAEDPEVREQFANSDWLVARAVAPLDRLVRWCLPLLSPGGRLLALKGASAADEVARHRDAMARAGAGKVEIRRLGAADYAEPTWAVVVRRAARPRVGTRGGA